MLTASLQLVLQCSSFSCCLSSVVVFCLLSVVTLLMPQLSRTVFPEHPIIIEGVLAVFSSIHVISPRAYAIVRCGGTHSVKWCRVYRTKRFNSAGSITSRKGVDAHSHTCLSGQLGSVEMLTLALLGRTAW